MAAACEARMIASGKEPVEQLSELFGNYKAEWLRERMFELFTRPAYFPQLENNRPCVLVGGRGTGKTTVLRSLSYEGQYVFSNRNDASINSWPYYGFYYRVDSNRVNSFQGPDLPERTWTTLFGHYINLLLCEQILDFLSWYEGKLPSAPTLPPSECIKVSLSLRVDESTTVAALVGNVEFARIRFEAYLNNLDRNSLPPMSMQGAPIAELMKALGKLPQFAGKYFLFLIDEYENFKDYQQVVVNTLIKHTGSLYSFKVGVKELGWRTHRTLTENEYLNSPADYVRIDIAESLGERFEEFASAICNQRIANLHVANQGRLPDIADLLPGMSDEEEARRLGVEQRVADSPQVLQLDEATRQKLSRLDPLEAYMVVFWSEAQKTPIHQVLEECFGQGEKWKTRYANYRHAILFTIKSAKAGIRKYYVGWRTFLLLANRNIRYLLELVDQTLLEQVREQKPLGVPVLFDLQTKVAERVGRKNLTELEGMAVQGAALTKLVLGLGRVYQVMAAAPYGHAPELNQFHLSDQGECPAAVTDLLEAAVMHLALVRNTATKLSDPSELKDYDYAIHPIFSPFFVFSHRKKRKMQLEPRRLLGLIENPAETIRDLLKSQGRSEDAPLPEQLQLFGSYYGSDR